VEWGWAYAHILTVIYWGRLPVTPPDCQWRVNEAFKSRLKRLKSISVSILCLGSFEFRLRLMWSIHWLPCRSVSKFSITAS